MSRRSTSRRLRANVLSKAEKLALIKGYGTRYEIVVTFPNKHKMLVAYTPKRSKAGLLDAIRGKGATILTYIPDLPDTPYTYSKTSGFILGDGTRINFSGRTQHDAIVLGELPFVGA